MRNLGKFLQSVFAIVAWCMPVFVWGQFWISEIHYNPEGADSGYEWIEIWNNSDQDRSLQDYVLRENGTNHRLKQEKDSWIVPAQGRVVIADNPAKFKKSHSHYQGTVIDSAFSLSNKGELLQLINPHEQIEFQVDYTPSTGGNGNGHSIGLIADVWQEVLVSPGQTNTAVPVVNKGPGGDATDNTKQPDNAASSDNISSPTVAVDVSPATYIEIKNPDYQEQVIKVDAGGDRTVMAGVSYWFSGKVFGLTGKELHNDPSVRWNWGDGSSGSGLVDQHRYVYPGEYTVTLSASVLDTSGRDRVKVVVIPPALELAVQKFEGQLVLGVSNTSLYGLEISHNVVSDGVNKFVFPEGTFVNAGQTIWLDQQITTVPVNYDAHITLQDAIEHEIDSMNISQYVLEQQVAQAKQDAETKREEELTETERLPVGQADAFTESHVNEPTHSQVFIYPDISGVEDAEQKEGGSVQDHVSIHTPQQSAQIISATGSHSDSVWGWQSWAMLILVVVAGGLYVWEQRKNKPVSLSGIEIID